MQSKKTIDVFGVSNNITIDTYIERPKVDKLFNDGLSTNKHIIIYGSSKQGKTSLTLKHLKDNIIKIDCSQKTEPIDIYKTILRKSDIEFEEKKETSNTVSTEGKAEFQITVRIPFIGPVGATGGGTRNKEKASTKTTKKVEYNLLLPDDVSDLLHKISFNKKIILENFHYLSEDTQNQLSFDLRVFADHNIAFIILGIWREKNRISQFNGDLLDRFIEVPVEPWENTDLLMILKKGEVLLNVDFTGISQAMIDTCFDSVGVFQELCKETCYAADVFEHSAKKVKITQEHLQAAIDKKLSDYSTRHISSLQSLVKKSSAVKEEMDFFIPYYFLVILFTTNLDSIVSGLTLNDLYSKIKAIHHLKKVIVEDDILDFMQNIIPLQTTKKISPPIFDYDRLTATIKIIDSTFYFFIRNCNRRETFASIPSPLPRKNVNP